MSKPIAYLLEPPRVSIEHLHENYEVRYVLDRAQAKQLHNEPEILYSYVRAWALANFVPDQDCFALTGQLTMVVMASLAISDAWPGHPIKLLRYLHHSQEYRETSYGHHTTTSA